MSKIALVTGASRGIGAATAVKLAQQSCDVAVNCLSCSEEAGYITGETIGVTGDLYMR